MSLGIKNRYVLIYESSSEDYCYLYKVYSFYIIFIHSFNKPDNK